ncbi:transposase [Prosthecobacter fluviatilis]|uniref:Transposase n=1 Tax=Prosthecobacter fluviatilis TaxID=445931 RepID=A0ABW0KQN6_9BACT
MPERFQFFNPVAGVTVTRGNLPHWDQAQSTYFITWRTADSIPRVVWQRWRQERNSWLLAHDINPASRDWRLDFEMLDEAARDDFRQFARSLESELDGCHGECALRDPQIARLVADALHHFDGSRYVLGDYVVMPNHVHLLVGGLAREAMLKQVESWKRWMAIGINQTLGRSGRFWQDESFDHLVRNEASFEKFRAYIARNPVMAGLKTDHFLLWQRPAA